MNIFVNALNSKSGGGKSILTNFLVLLSENPLNKIYYFLVPNTNKYERFESDFIHILKLPRLYSKTCLFPYVNRFVLPGLIERCGCTLIFNLADIPIPSKIKQVFLFDWPYAVFPESPVWKMMDFFNWLTRKTKLFFFKKNLKYVDLMIAQSPAIKLRLEKYFGISDIEVIPNSVSIDNLKRENTCDFRLGNGLNLLCLTYYYPHKNIEVLIPLAREIASRRENFRIITTIAPEQHPMAKRFLHKIEKLGLQGVIKNIGPVSMRDVPSLYAQTDGLLLPTLLESFSGTYVEAMFHGKPIFTSELDFATGVCADAAYYFDPLNPDEILEKILESQNDPAGRNKRIEAGRRILAEHLTWEQAFHAYLQLFNKALQG